MYDYDGNGVLDQNDFECLAVRNTILEGKGDWNQDKYEKNKKVMIDLWQQICEIADFDKNNEVDTEEFMHGVETACKGKAYDQLPEAFKFFIEAQFRTIDVDGELLKTIEFIEDNTYYTNINAQVMARLVLRSFVTTA